MSASQSAAVPCRATACQQQSSAPRAAAEAWRGRRLVSRAVAARAAGRRGQSSLDWPQHRACGTDLRSLRGRVDGGDHPQRLVLIHHLESKQTLYVACSLPACTAGEQTHKRPIAQANKRRHRGRRRPGRWLCRGMGSPRCEGFRAARSALRVEEGSRRAFSGNATAGPLCVSVCRASVRTCVCACVCACAFV